MLLTRRCRSSAKAKVHPKPRAKANAGDAFDEALRGSYRTECGSGGARAGRSLRARRPARVRPSAGCVRPRQAPCPGSGPLFLRRKRPPLRRLCPRYCVSANRKRAAFALGLFVTLAAPKILRLGKNASKLAFFARLIRIFGCAEDTLARQTASELAFALAYSYLCPHRPHIPGQP